MLAPAPEQEKVEAPAVGGGPAASGRIQLSAPPQKLDLDSRTLRPGSGQSAAGDSGSDDDAQAPSLSIGADPQSGGAPLTVHFVAEIESPRSDMQVHWDFGDGTSASGQATVDHTYVKPDDYTATFTLTWHGDAQEDSVDIQVSEAAFDVDVEVDPDSGPAPLAVTFTASVDEDDVPDVDRFEWDLGDGSKDHGKSVRHTYRAPGTYTAVVTAFNGAGQHGSKEVEIEVTEPEDPAPIENGDS